MKICDICKSLTAKSEVQNIKISYTNYKALAETITVEAHLNCFMDLIGWKRK